MRIILKNFCLLFYIICLFGLSAQAQNKKPIMIDLDGVLDNYTRYSDEIPEIRIGAKDFVKTLSKDYELVLFTTRNSKQALVWLQKNKIDKYFSNVTNVKIPAYIYLDDRAIKFNGDYNKTLDEINNFKTYWNE